MTQIYRELEKADLIIFGSPTYFGNVSAMMKTFMDRCNPYWFNQKLKGKKAIILAVGGSPIENIKKMVTIFDPFTIAVGLEIMDRYCVQEEEADGVSKNEKAIEELQ